MCSYIENGMSVTQKIKRILDTWDLNGLPEYQKKTWQQMWPLQKIQIQYDRHSVPCSDRSETHDIMSKCFSVFATTNQHAKKEADQIPKMYLGTWTDKDISLLSDCGKHVHRLNIKILFWYLIIPIEIPNKIGTLNEKLNKRLKSRLSTCYNIHGTFLEFRV